MSIKQFTADMDVNARIVAWDHNAKLLKVLKVLEMEQRKQLVKEIFPDIEKGTHHHELGGGYKLTTVRKIETKLDEAAYQLILPELEAKGEEAKAAIAAAVKYTPSLVMKGYNNLSGEVKELFDEAVTTKDASPTLTLVVPKA